ncbi:MAG: cytochrome c3 family protein [Pseudomonadota bacterium]
MKKILFFLGCAGLLLGVWGITGKAMPLIKTSECISCHGKVYDQGRSYKFAHTIFSEKKCKQCHIKSQAENIAKEWGPVVKPEEVSQPGYSIEHALIFQGLDKKSRYDFKAVARNTAGQEMVLWELGGIIPEEAVRTGETDVDPPVISKVKNSPVVKRIFIETAILWETSEPTTCRVEYGLSEKYGSKGVMDSLFKTRHEVTITGLEQSKTYHYRIVARDMRGNESASSDFIIDTSVISPLITTEDTAQESLSGAHISVKRYQWFLADNNLGLYIETTEPVTLKVEYLKVPDGTVDAALHEIEAMALGKEPGMSKKGLRTGRELRIDLCYECHTPDTLGVSHPVGVVLRKGMKPPPDLPLLDGSIITCVTCHENHGSNIPHFGRKQGRGLCDSCHADY